MRKTRSSRCISSRSAWFSASLYVTIAISALSRGRGRSRVAGRVDVHILGERVERWLRALVGKVPRVLHRRANFGIDGSHLLVRPFAALLHLRAQQSDRIALHVLVDLLLAAVRAARSIGHRVPHEAVGAHL